MENFYEILDSLPTDTTEQIKQKYQQLVLTLHPDKLQQQGIEPGQLPADVLARYHSVQKAWDILGNPELRKEYDARWSQRTIAQKWPVQEVVDLAEFDCDAEDTKTFVYSCRCGGEFVLTETDVSFCVDYVCCGICSLCIQVTYQQDNG